MIKKDSPAFPRPGDFFSDIAQDLQSQVEGLAAPEDAALAERGEMTAKIDDKAERLDSALPTESKESAESQEPSFTPSSDIFDAQAPKAEGSPLFPSHDPPTTNGLHSSPPPLPLSASPSPEPEAPRPQDASASLLPPTSPLPPSIEIEIDLDPPVFAASASPVSGSLPSSPPPSNVPPAIPAVLDPALPEPLALAASDASSSLSPLPADALTADSPPASADLHLAPPTDAEIPTLSPASAPSPLPSEAEARALDLPLPSSLAPPTPRPETAPPDISQLQTLPASKPPTPEAVGATPTPPTPEAVGATPTPPASLPPKPELPPSVRTLPPFSVASAERPKPFLRTSSPEEDTISETIDSLAHDEADLLEPDEEDEPADPGAFARTSPLPPPLNTRTALPTPVPSASAPPTPPVPSASAPPTPPVPSASAPPTPPVPSASAPPTPVPSASEPPTSPAPSSSAPTLPPPVPSASAPTLPPPPHKPPPTPASPTPPTSLPQVPLSMSIGSPTPSPQRPTPAMPNPAFPSPQTTGSAAASGLPGAQPSGTAAASGLPGAQPSGSAAASGPSIKRTGSQSVLRQNPIACPQCGKSSSDPIWCEFCGAPLQKPENQPFDPSQKGLSLDIDGHTYVLQRDVSRSAERVVWEAQRGDLQQSQPYIVEEISPQRYRAGYYRLPDLTGTCIHRPFATLERSDRIFLISSPLAGYRLDRALEEGQYWSVEEIYSIISAIGETISKIHSFGALFLQLDARQIWMTEEDEPRLLAVERLYNEKTPFHLRPKREGYSAPEAYQPRLPISVASDVYSLGLLLHYLISQARPFNHLDTPDPDIPSPRVYHLDFPVGLEAIVKRACHPRPSKRFPTVEAFLEDLDQAVFLIRQRTEAERAPLQLAVGHDIHIGVSKGNRNPVNQDALFWRYDRARGKGLFLVADGVSHCHYGSGDRASSFLIQAARKRWETLLQKPIMDEPLSPDQRRQILSSIFEAANQAIGREINERYERIDGYVEDVMGSTCVAGFLDANEITIGNLGDSRAYLRALNFLEQITIDHDYKTAQIQAGMDLRSILSLQGGALITRCVGSFRKDEQMKILPRKLQPDFFDLTLLPGDTLLLSSDGLPDYAGPNDEEARANIAQILDTYPDPLSACFWLIALANRNGGGDNISVLEIKVLS